MSRPWRCAVCEALNEGGETCAACGAPRAETAARATTAHETTPRDLSGGEEPGSEVPVRELPVRRPQSETPQYGGPDIDEFFDLGGRADVGDGDDEAESFHARPRVRVYGCCLPICLVALVVFLGAATVLAHALARAL